jgi:hypothetical protein
MKPVQIEFIENHRWRWMSAVLAVTCLTLASGFVWRGAQLNTAVAQENDRIGALQSQLRRRSAPVQNKVDPRQRSAEQVALLLQQDLNRGFTAAENLQEPGALLRALALDTTSGVLRLEYDLDTVVKAAVITETLNSGYETHPWRLEGLSGPTADGFVAHGATLPMVPAAPLFRGVWSVRLNSL